MAEYESKYKMVFEKGSNATIVQDPVYNAPVNFYGGSTDKLRKKAPHVEVDDGELPEELLSDEAMALLEAFRDAGMLDERWQPVNLSRAFKAVLANSIAEELRLKNKWSLFQRLWSMKALSSAYTRALRQDNVVQFIKDVNKIIEG